MELEGDFGWALIGPGTVARRFATATHDVPNACLRKVYGRNPTRTSAFVAACRNAHGTLPLAARELDELLEDPRIDAIYIATTHVRHGEFDRAGSLLEDS